MSPTTGLSNHPLLKRSPKIHSIILKKAKNVSKHLPVAAPAKSLKEVEHTSKLHIKK